MEQVVFSNPLAGTSTELDCEPWKPSVPVPREMVENDALALALGGGNAKDIVLYQVMNQLGTLVASKDIDVKDAAPEIGASVWAALPMWQASQGVETGAPTSLWCKDGH
jgi:hypothetical protein